MAADGIRIQDAAIEISSQGLESLLRKQGTAVTVTKLDLTVSPEALNSLLAGVTPEGQAAPRAQLETGRLQVEAQPGGKPLSLDLQVGGLRVEITADGLRLVTG